MRFLLTGGAGFIGSHLADALTARGDEVVVLDDLSTGRRANLAAAMATGRLDFVEGSVCDERCVLECMQSVDACLHLASAVGVKLILERPVESLLTNVRGNDTVISAAAALKRRLLYASTSEVYGKNSTGALREDADRLLGSALTARWNYATSKAFGEALAYGYHRELGSEVVVVRLFNTVGPRQAGAYGMVLPRFVRQALAGEDLTVYGDGSQSRCFAHVHDTVRAILLLLDDERANGRAYNIGATTEVTIRELARRVIERTRSSSGVRLVAFEDAYPDGFEELGRRKADTTALRELTGWTAARTVDDAIDDVSAHQRAAANERGVVPVA
jgi:UDP-glucose 4-epimerase